MKLTEKQKIATERVLVYGPPKSGKSLIVGKLAEHYNLLWLDNEQGWGVLRKLPVEWQERINIVSIPDSKVFPIAAETWMKAVKGTLVEICEAHGKVACAICKKAGAVIERIELNRTPANTIVVFDSLTQLSQSFIAHITKAQPDDYKLEFDDWSNLKTLVEKFLSQIQVAGYNVVCITHEEEVEFEDKRKKIVPVCGSSKSSRNTAKYFDHVVYVDIKNKKHVAGSSTMYGMGLVTGSRTDVALEDSEKPSLLDIFTSWKGGFEDGGSDGSDNSNPGLAYSSSVDQLVGVSADVKDRNAALLAATKEIRAAEKEQEIVKKLADVRTPGQVSLDNLRAKMNTGK